MTSHSKSYLSCTILSRFTNALLIIGLLAFPVQAQNFVIAFDDEGLIILNTELRRLRLNLLDPDKVDADYLSEITANFGDITAGNVTGVNFTGNTFSGETITGSTITGSTIQTATSGPRIWMDINNFVATGDSAVFRIYLSGSEAGDVVIGDYDSSKGVKWDDSEDTFNIKGTITADSGTIGGWHITSGALADNATAGNANILLDSANGLIRAGDTGATYITIDGANNYIRTSDYASGPLGSGWHVGTDLAEFNNIRARGKITTAVFEKDVISSLGGNFLVSDSDILNSDMTALDASTLTILGDTTFAVNDILRLKDNGDDEWLVVTNIASAPTYTVTRDAGSDYTANNNPTWKKGTAVVNYGASGEGLIFMTASEANAPHIDVLTHAGAPWDTTTTRMRLGNVNGFLGAATDLYGIYIGESDKYLKYDPTNGLQIKGKVTIEADSSGYDNLSDKLTDAEVREQTGWSHASAETKIDGGDIYANTIVLAALGSAVTDRMFVSADSATRVQNWAAAENATMIDGGDIYTGSVLVGSMGADAVARMFSAEGVRNAVEGWKHATETTLIDGGDIYAGSTITIGSSGHIKSGQTAYDTGTGWWLGDVSGTPKFSIGDSTSNSLTWDGATLTVDGTIDVQAGGISQIQLNTATVENCVTVEYFAKDRSNTAADSDIDAETGQTFAFPAGLYGLYPQIAVTMDSSDSAWHSDYCGESAVSCPYSCAQPEWDYYVNMDFLERGDAVQDGIVTDSSDPLTFTTYGFVYLGIDWGTPGQNVNWTCYDQGCSKSRYITSSNDQHWIWLLVNKSTGKIKASQYSRDHPSVGNDPSITHPFGKISEDEEVVLADPEIIDKIKDKVSSNRSILQVINKEYQVDSTSKPVFSPVKIKEIDPYGDRPGTVIKTEYDVPAWGQAVVGKSTVDIKERTISSLPTEIKYRKLKKKTAQIGELP